MPRSTIERARGMKTRRADRIRRTGMPLVVIDRRKNHPSMRTPHRRGRSVGGTKLLCIFFFSLRSSLYSRCISARQRRVIDGGSCSRCSSREPNISNPSERVHVPNKRDQAFRRRLPAREGERERASCRKNSLVDGSFKQGKGERRKKTRER